MRANAIVIKSRAWMFRVLALIEGRLGGVARAYCNVENAHTRCNVGRAQQEGHEVSGDVCKGAIMRQWWPYIAAVLPAHVLAEAGVGMPIGQMLVAQARESGWDGAVLFVSGFADQANVARMGGNLFLAKPFGAEELRDQVARILDAETDKPSLASQSHEGSY